MKRLALKRKLRLVALLCRDLVVPTWSASRPGEHSASAWSGDLTPPLGSAPPDEVIELYLSRRFDLLGSGWTRPSFGLECRGVDGIRYPAEALAVSSPRSRVNRANRSGSRRLAALLDKAYVPIDWQRDFKSGYRWSERTWYRLVRTAPAEGADIKVPWELARMQHLPQLALAYSDPDSRWHRDGKIPAEFRNQVIDFLAANPPRFGVNWKCTMDVGIRVANWILAREILHRGGADFDGEFDRVFAAGVRDHAKHVVRNLEWLAGRRANHYLGNIAGLLFCACWLPRSRASDAWLTFGVQELVNEVEYQFLPDGGHFEGSTAYHRFALEMVVFATAAVLGQDPARIQTLRTGEAVRVGERAAVWPTDEASDGEGEEPFPRYFWERLERAHAFLQAVCAPDGTIVRVGDDDSGRLFDLSPAFLPLPVHEAQSRFANLAGYRELPEQSTYWFRVPGDAGSVLSAVTALLGTIPASDDQRQECASGRVVQALMRTACGRPDRLVRERGRATRRSQRPRAIRRIDLSEPPTRVRTFRGSRDLTDGLVLTEFPDFGCYVYRSPGLYLLIRAWERTPPYTAHMHNDQLAVILWLEGREVITDPGSFLYTPSPHERNRYRSVRAHDTPWPSEADEPSDLGCGPFAVVGAVPARIVQVERERFVGEFEARDLKVARSIRIQDEKVCIEDWTSRAAPKYTGAPPPAPGYGIRLAGHP